MERTKSRTARRKSAKSKTKKVASFSAHILEHFAADEIKSALTSQPARDIALLVWVWLSPLKAYVIAPVTLPVLALPLLVALGVALSLGVRRG